MSVREFLDTNVLVYAYDPSGRRKQQIAQSLVRRALLTEFAATLLHKMSPAAPPEDVAALFDALGPIGVVVPDGDLVRRAEQGRGAYGIHFYDGMIVAAAERGGCERLWSEDLNSGQQYFGVTVENPFR